MMSDPQVCHNEVVVDPRDWGAKLPGVIRAFFYATPSSAAPTPNDLNLAAAGERAARAAHRDFAAQFPGASVPLVKLDASKREAPWELVA